MLKLKHLFTGSQITCLYIGQAKFPNVIKGIAINGDLNRSYQISMNFDYEKETIREIHHFVGFPTSFVGNVIHQFFQKLNDKQTEYELIIP